MSDEQAGSRVVGLDGRGGAARPPGRRFGPAVLALGLVVLVGLGVLASPSGQTPLDTTAEPVGVLEWRALTPPSPALRRASLGWSQSGYIVLGVPEEGGTTLWSSAGGEVWTASDLNRSPQGVTIRDDELVMFGGLEAVTLRFVSGAWAQTGEIELPAFARSGYESGRPALVDAGGELFLHSVEGELFHRGTDGAFGLVIDKGLWWAPTADAWERFTSPLARNSCRPPFEGSLDYPPLVDVAGGYLAFVPLMINGPNLTWPVCDPQAWRSPDGAEWQHDSNSGLGPGSFVYDVVSDERGLIAVGGVGETQPALWRSDDGFVWVRLAWPATDEPSALSQIEAGEFGYVVVGRNAAGSNGRAWFSDDGLCWHAVPEQVNAAAVAVGADSLVIADARPDGPLWVAQRTGTSDASCDIDAAAGVD